jgi:hypothetical protein
VSDGQAGLGEAAVCEVTAVLDEAQEAVVVPNLRATFSLVRHTVICPDLRVYGVRDKPTATDADVYAKRTMVAFRAGLDHPETITHLGILDIVPTLDMWNVLHGASAAVGYHLFLMAQPPGLPEAMIAGSADAFFGSFLDAWANDPAIMPEDVRVEYLRASASAVTSIVADYRASADIDVIHDPADLDAGSQLAMPVTVVQQDWGAQLGYDAAAVWKAWAPDLDHRLTRAGHFMAEEAPGEITAAIQDLLARRVSCSRLVGWATVGRRAPGFRPPRSSDQEGGRLASR